MTTPMRPRSARAGRLAVAGTLLAAVLLATGCSASPEGTAPAPSDPHGTAAPGQPSSGTASAAPTDAEATAQASDARADQRAVGAAAERAASFGFTQQVSATDAEIQRTREESRLRQTNTSGTTVEPAGCKAPLTAVDWSPILLPGADAARLDFGSEGFTGTGSVEVASLEDPEVLERHLANVERLVADCPDLTMTVTDENLQKSTFDVTARASRSDGADVDSGLVWTRTPAGGGAETTAQVLIGRAGDHVVMVSFIGQPEVAGEEFTTIGEQVLAAAVGSL
ncbi:hypothetical protein [Citricoccus zhacaiensis]|uniref:hypothetical protein n=2 Tax=Citricoccus TaxID=169133 RepID=UPI003CF42CFF